MSVAQLTIPSSYSGTTVKWSLGTNLPSSNYFTCMCWAYGTSLVGDTYRDLICDTDGNNVAGIGLKLLSGSNYNVNLGDLNTDNVGTRTVQSNQWHHYCMTIAPTAAGTRCIGYLDGHLEVGPVSLVAPTPATTFQIWNSRASSTDAGSQWLGVILACKIWDRIEMDGGDIMNEMMFYQPQRLQDLWAYTPVFDIDSKAMIFGGRGGTAWTFTGTVTSSLIYPPGVCWDNPKNRRRTSRFLPPAASAATPRGILVPSLQEDLYNIEDL